MQELLEEVLRSPVAVFGAVTASAHPFLAVWLHRCFPDRPVVLINGGVRAQERAQQDLETWLWFFGEVGETPTADARRMPLYFPAWEILPHEDKLPHADVISERLSTLSALMVDSSGSEGRLVNTTVSALMQRTFPREVLQRESRRLQCGDTVPPRQLMDWLESHGYEPEAQTTGKGECSMRGGILDVFALPYPWPVRMEFFGDELESLRYFDPASQISRETISSVVLPPAGELGLLKTRLAGGDLSHEDLADLTDYLPDSALVVISLPVEVHEHAREYARQVASSGPFFTGWEEVLKKMRDRGMTLVQLDDFSGESTRLAFENLESMSPLGDRPAAIPVREAQREAFFRQMQRWLRQGYSVQVFCNNLGEQQRFEEIWNEMSATASPPAQPTCYLGGLSCGFVFEAGRLAVVTDAEIFGRYKIQRPRRLTSPHAQAMRSAWDIDFSDLEEGDYVVHIQHGIGKFLGLHNLPAPATREAGGGERSQECLAIEYAPSDPADPPPRLFVPVTEAHLVTKYIGASKARPKLNRLGGSRWRKARGEAEKAVQDLASQFLSLQAKRQSLPGHGFAADSTWQREFESAFLYEETPDQASAIAAMKADMEAPRPMDRLICGDVGYGKTEVAIRAAFKAVMGGKQVAMLVPTTILAQQHFNTLTERMADYPVQIELLSRFRSRRRQNQILKELAAGSIDIVVGTHRLIQNDVVFKDLGLVVIDEEQRFGVLHKERLKQLREMIDVLTLSATPIPRTLYLALTGARDMSTIETAPQDRLPIETIVVPYDENVIRNAIQRELNREGQVFFLHNRVTTIDGMARRLQAIVPQARLLVGHGQMSSDSLEKIMTRFVNGEADILLATTIIESGIDIPNANTIIIDRADRFGLSQLYQLRGRVGRYKHQAYAYLLLPRHARLLSDVRKRMTAIRQYSNLGSGFKIAMRDLELRGAGNLLGAEQSGHISAIGFDLYCQLLKQSVARLRGESLPQRIQVNLRLDFLDLDPLAAQNTSNSKSHPGVSRERIACLPYDYVAESRQRIELYRKLAQAADSEALERLKAEIRDRFGPLPPPVERLFRLGEIRLLAAAKQITSLATRGDKFMLTRNREYLTIGGKFPRLEKQNPDARLREIHRLLRSI